MADKQDDPAPEQKEYRRLEAAIERGGSVLHKGKLIRTKEQLKRAFETLEDIDAQIKELSERKEQQAQVTLDPKKSAPKK